MNPASNEFDFFINPAFIESVFFINRASTDSDFSSIPQLYDYKFSLMVMISPLS